MNNDIDFIIIDLEQKIKNSYFNSKTSLNDYILKLRENQFINESLSNQRILELFKLYDSLYPNDNLEIDTQNYKSISLDNQNLVVSTKDDVILKTNTSGEEMIKEFKDVQNNLTSMTQDKLANADIVFENMRNSKKEELTLLTLSEIIERDNIDLEVMNKIKFFISNQHINPYSFKVDPNEGIFYNIETSEVFEVIKNEQTGNYEIYKGGEIQFVNNESLGSDNNMDDDEYEKKQDSEREKMPYNYSKPKIRKLVKNDFNKKGIVKNSFIVIVILFVSIIISLLLLNFK